MAQSDSATAVAKELSEIVRKGGSIRRGMVSKIMLKYGYAPSTAEKPGRVVKSQSFQKEMSPVLIEIEELQMLAAKQGKKTIGKANASTAAYVLDVATKNLQLLRGKATSIQYGAHIDLTPQEEKKIRKLLS